MQKQQDNPINHLNIWVGAGISMNEPSSLPSGNQLTKFVLDTVILDSDKLLDVWNQINAYEEKYIHTNPYPRLELILSSIVYIEKYFKLGNFIDGLQSFDEVPFNRNHCLLAALLHAGATIMTANFDLGIERAYHMMYPDEDIKQNRKGKIIHFHGTCYEGYKAGTTIENITRLVNKQLYRKIRHCFSAGERNLFVGYSFSDMYDINSIIIELYNRETLKVTNENWVCNHCGLDKALPDKAKYNFGKENVHICSEDTTIFLENICDKYGVKKPQDEGLIDSLYVSDSSWSTKFINKIHITEDFKVLATIHLLNRMAIAVDKINSDILDKYLKIKPKLQTDKTMIMEYYLTTNSYYWYQKYGNTRLNVFYSKKLADRCMWIDLEVFNDNKVSADEIDKAIGVIRRKNYVMYDEFAILSQGMNWVKLMMINGEKDMDIDLAKKFLSEFFDFPIGAFIEIVLYASVYRYQMLINSLTNKEVFSLFNVANLIYYDTGNVDGIISSQIDRFISEYHASNSDKWRKIIESDEWTNMEKLCDNVGTYRFRYLIDYIKLKRTV